MTNVEFQIFACLVLGLDPTNNSMGKGNKGHNQHNHSLVNMLFADFTMITNLNMVIHKGIEDGQRDLAQALTRCSLLLLGSHALTPSIIQWVWGANDAIRKTFGAPCGNLALIQRCLVSLLKIAINTFHFWAITNFDKMRIITNEVLHCHPPGLCDIIKSLHDPTTAKYAQEPLAQGTTHIYILLTNLRNSMMDPTSITSKDAAVSWYSNLLLNGHITTDTTGVENKIFLAFDVTTHAHPT
jgi:hypothetical protein